MKKKKQDEDSPEDAFIRGFATALSIIQSGWHESNLVVLVLVAGGFKYDDFVNAGVDKHDLKLIREAFKRENRPLRRRPPA